MKNWITNSFMIEVLITVIFSWPQHALQNRYHVHHFQPRAACHLNHPVVTCLYPSIRDFAKNRLISYRTQIHRQSECSSSRSVGERKLPVKTIGQNTNPKKFDFFFYQTLKIKIFFFFQYFKTLKASHLLGFFRLNLTWAITFRQIVVSCVVSVVRLPFRTH